MQDKGTLYSHEHIHHVHYCLCISLYVLEKTLNSTVLNITDRRQ